MTTDFAREMAECFAIIVVSLFIMATCAIAIDGLIIAIVRGI